MFNLSWSVWIWLVHKSCDCGSLDRCFWIISVVMSQWITSLLTDLVWEWLQTLLGSWRLHNLWPHCYFKQFSNVISTLVQELFVMKNICFVSKWVETENVWQEHQPNSRIQFSDFVLRKKRNGLKVILCSFRLIKWLISCIFLIEWAFLSQTSSLNH